MTDTRLDPAGLEAAAKALHADIEESMGAADWTSASLSYKQSRLHDATTAIRAYLSTLHGQQSEAVAWAAVKDGKINWNYGFWRELPAIVWSEGEGAIPLYAHPLPTTTGVSEAMVERAYDAYVSQLETMLISGKRIDKNEFRYRRSAMRAALEAALTAPAGDGVPCMVVVNVEPNDDQIRQLFSMNSALPRTTEEAVAVYRAILNCASTAGGGK